MTSKTLTYLDTAAEGLPPVAVEAALAEYWREKNRGTPGRERHYEGQAQAAKYSWKRMAEQTLDIYERAIAQV